MKKFKRIVNKLKKIMGMFLHDLYDVLMLLFKILPATMFIITPYISMFIAIMLYEQRGGLYYGGEWLLPLAIIILAILMKYVYENETEDSEYDGCPVARKRFTQRGKNGVVRFDNSEIHEMIEYLAEVEDYCENRRKYGSNKD